MAQFWLNRQNFIFREINVPFYPSENISFMWETMKMVSPVDAPPPRAHTDENSEKYKEALHHENVP